MRGNKSASGVVVCRAVAYGYSNRLSGVASRPASTGKAEIPGLGKGPIGKLGEARVEVMLRPGQDPAALAQ